MIIIIENGQVQNLDEAVCILHTLEKGMNPIILPPAMDK